MSYGGFVMQKGQTIKTERGKAIVCMMDMHPYPTDPRPYIYVVALDNSWSDYILHSEARKLLPSIDPMAITRHDGCPDCGSAAEA
jgi:hypothetical protein